MSALTQDPPPGKCYSHAISVLRGITDRQLSRQYARIESEWSDTVSGIDTDSDFEDSSLSFWTTKLHTTSYDKSKPLSIKDIRQQMLQREWNSELKHAVLHERIVNQWLIGRKDGQRQRPGGTDRDDDGLSDHISVW